MNKLNIFFDFFLLIIIVVSFVFLVSISPYPAGDDPGFHTSILKSTIKYEKTNFLLPFFPQVKTPYDTGRFVTNVFLTALAKVTDYTEVFPLTIYFAAFCFSLSLIPIYLIVCSWLGSRPVALLGVFFLAFSKWYQENFWEGNYDQYTGLLLLSVFIYLFFLWYKKGGYKYFVLSFLLLLISYKTHQLGFLTSLIIFIIIFFQKSKMKIKSIFYYPILLILIILFVVLYLIIQPGYFAINSVGYSIPSLLSPSEGTSIFMYHLIILGLLFFIFSKRNFFVFVWFSVAFLFSQSFIFDLPFYPFRFNIYLMQVITVIYCLGLYILFKIIQQCYLRKVIWPFALIVLVLSFSRQSIYIYKLGSWITDQNDNPASVILKEDIAAFEWLKGNSDSSEVMLAPYKWGYYLPAIAEREVILDNAVGGDERDNRWEIAEKAREIYTTKSVDLAHELSLEIGADYIIWDASISRYHNRYPDYRERKFKDREKFLKVYHKNGVKIYKIL